MPICNYCSKDKSQNEFYFRKNEGRFEKTCKKCRNKKQWKRIKEGKVTKRETFDFKCKNCDIQKSSSDYYLKDKKTNRYDTTCKSCRKDDAKKNDAKKNYTKKDDTKKDDTKKDDTKKKEIQPSTDYYEEYKKNRRKWREDNKQIINEKHKKWREDNVEKYKETCKKWYQDNKESVKERSKKWYQDNYEKGKETRKKYRENNKEKCKESIKKWRENNKEKWMLGSLYRTKCRNSIKKSTKSKNKYLGCSGEYARNWLEFQFSEIMSWDNYGEVWEIDHVIPVCLFDMENEEDVKKCFHWTNIQPLTTKQNLEKYNSINEEIKTLHFKKIIEFMNNN